MARVFICYRRNDSSEVVKPLMSALTARLPNEAIFLDTESLNPGGDFRLAIYQAIAEVDVVLALIGPNWSASFAVRSKAETTGEEDHVRVELETALRLRRTVIPVLIDPAKRPDRASLPTTIQELLRTTTVRVDPEQNQGFDAVTTAVTAEISNSLKAKIQKISKLTGLNEAGIDLVLSGIRRASEVVPLDRRIAPQDILHALKETAQAQFGENWRACLARMDIRQSEDVGIITYSLIMAGVLDREPSDHPSEFWGLGEL